MSTDVNHTSYTQDPAGNVYRNGHVILPAGVTPRVLDWRGTPLGTIDAPPGQYADALKFSGVTDLEVYMDAVYGGREDCLDVNAKCRGLIVHIAHAYPRGRYVATIKGASDRVHLSIDELHGKGKESDIDLGNHSDQARGRTRNVSIHIGKAPHRPRVTVKHAWDPVLTGVPMEVDDRLQGWFAHVWRVIKRLFRV